VAPRGRPSPVGGGGGGGGGDSDSENDGGDDGDDCEENPRFHNYYRVTPQQRKFNLEAKDHFKKAGSNRTSAVYRPKDVLKARARPPARAPLHACSRAAHSSLLPRLGRPGRKAWSVFVCTG
jgi:hypothetical protein